VRFTDRDSSAADHREATTARAEISLEASVAVMYCRYLPSIGVGVAELGRDPADERARGHPLGEAATRAGGRDWLIL
jgi:hypothetical protein